MNSTNKFRYDINGLRALAVILVVLFHFKIPFFSAGFIGVDIFFVISGYLMTSIVCKGVEAGRFSFWEFYTARARRIWPGLIVLCLAVLALGWFILITSDYKIMATHVRESLLFTSNIKYLSEAGYFDEASHSKWLLHTWSLSVEWQFYLFYPLFVVAFNKFFNKSCSLKNNFIFHVFLAAIFFAINIYYISFDASKSFYSVEARAWEMLLGGFVYFIQNRQAVDRLRQMLIASGAALFVLSLFLIDLDTKWPGFLAILPTLGTFFIILANKRNLLANVKM